MLQSGTLIGNRYEVESPLASGGSGLVFSATDRTTEKRVAVKVLGPHLLHERAAREKLRLEAIVAGRVESEHIVQVSDAGVDVATGVPFIVMELLKGQNLQEHVEQQGPLEPSVAVEYLRQVASGLDKAHGWKDRDARAAPIVHRDLKPENLFLTHREDGSPVIKILDFGLAKVLSASATLSSEVKGTPLYMAPEQLSQAQITPATDIWALGLVAFYFLSAKSYWLTGQDERAILPAVIKEVTDGAKCPASARLRELAVVLELPLAFDDWFATCLNPDPNQRYRSAGEAVRALAQALDCPLPSSPTATGVRISSSGRISVPPVARARDSRSDHATHATISNPALATIRVAARSAGTSPLLRRALRPWLMIAALVVVAAAALVWTQVLGRRVAPATGPAASTSNALTPDGEGTAAARSRPTANVEDAPAATSLAAPQRPEEFSMRAPSTATATSDRRAADLAASPSPSAKSIMKLVPRTAARASAPNTATPAKAAATAEIPQQIQPAPASTLARPRRDPADHR